MAYILSLLTSKSPDQFQNQVASLILCYHINDTTDTQIIRVISESTCHLERVVFPGERVLFEAFLDAYFEVRSPFLGGTRTTRSECRLFQVNEA